MQNRDALTALSPGVPLWLIPPLEVSEWTQRIDWYLGFQIRRARSYRRFDFGADMRQLMESYENVVPKIPRTEDAPLMIASRQLLPNHQTVVVPSATDRTAWVATCFRVWKGLDRPSARVFLPPGLSRDEFVKLWPDQGHDEIEIVSSAP